MATAPAHRRQGFTLIELLVVIAILAMLMAIALPSLVRAKVLAKKAKTATELATISTNLEVFQTDYRHYPESNATRIDPITNLPGANNDPRPIMQGAHWLARALAGPDGEGIDLAGLVLKDRQYVAEDAGTGQLKAVDSGGPGGTITALQKTTRRSRYLGSTKLLAQDSDTSVFAKPFDATSGQKGRFVLADAFGGPILYYRASPRATFPFTTNETGTGPTEGPAVYNLHDNAAITGCNGPGLSPSTTRWDFSNTTLLHGLGYFGPSRDQIQTSPASVRAILPAGADYRGRSFADFLHDAKTYATGSVIRPVNAETFALISSGKDALFGTDDDITNFDPR